MENRDSDPGLITDQARFEDLIQKSKFIFKGKVQKLKAANMGSLQVTDDTSVVMVNEVLHGPSMFSTLTGKEITAELDKTQPLAVGDTGVFCTNGYWYGESLAVKDMGHFKVGNGNGSLRKQVTDAVQKVADKALQSRISSAELLVVGRVTNIRPLQSDRKPTPDFDDAQNSIADVAIDSVLKGSYNQKNIEVTFSNSPSSTWLNVPKLKVGGRKIFILSKGQAPGTNIEVFMAFEKSVVQDVDQLDRITNLIRSSGGSRGG